ncbi:hypothetical protein EON80_19400 [bacterium]|nr:MAG: hypothetical protein EON80_19400 [bacterium]
MTYPPAAKRWPTPLEIFKWFLVFLPLIVIIPAVGYAREFDMVIREDTMRPVMGIPKSLVYLSLLGGAGYILMLATFCREQVLNSGQGCGLILMQIGLTPIIVMASGQALNGVLDPHPAQRHQAKVQGKSLIGRRTFGRVQDWRNPREAVFLPGGETFTYQYPVDSLVTVVTKRGLFGYEYLIEVVEPPPKLGRRGVNGFRWSP